MIRVCLIVSVLVIAGCASLTLDTQRIPWYVMPAVGSYVNLNQELRRQSGARIYLQRGEVRSRGGVYEGNPYCQFYVFRTLDELREPLVIAEDRFVIEKVYRRKDVVAADGAQYAGILRNDNSPSQVSMSTYLEIFSSRQPNVTRLICSRWADPYDHNHVRVNEIEESLGDVAELVPAG